MYHFRDSAGPVDVGFTDRRGGVSSPPYDGLNLALEGDDDPASCAANLAAVRDDFAPGAVVADMRQVHGREVGRVVGPPSGRPDCDALVTDHPDVLLVVRAADCVPVVLADPVAGVVGVAHAGRPGVLAGVVPAVVAAMTGLGASSITAWVGPHVCAACYEVPEAMRAEVAAAVPSTWAVSREGTPALDLGAGVRSQLTEAGVDVLDVSACTRESPELYSYRRDGRAAGRLAGLVRRRTA